MGLHRLQEWAPEQEALGKQVRGKGVAIAVAGGLGEADLDHLRRVIPLIDGPRRIKPLMALEPDQLASQRRGQRMSDLGLADPGLALEKSGRPSFSARKITVANARSET